MTATKPLHNNGSVEISRWTCDDILLTHSVSTYNSNGLHSGKTDQDMVHLHFGLKGNYSMYHRQLNRSFDLIGGHHNIFYSEGFEMEFFNKTLLLETFGIQFPREIFLSFTQNANEGLKRFSEKVLENKPVILSDEWASLNLKTESVIQEIINCPYDDGLKKLFLLSKSIELLVLSAEACLSKFDDIPKYIKQPADKEKIIAARDLINENLHEPPSLSQIAKTTGLNEYKLKRGFKEIFHTTVFNYLTDQRMSLARQYLLDTQKTAAEISLELGFATPQHFNNAFKKKFGIPPNMVRKNPE